MMGTDIAAIAAHAGRGNRIAAQGDTDKDYEIMLPFLPACGAVLNTLFLHGVVRGRPYKVDDV